MKAFALLLIFAVTPLFANSHTKVKEGYIEFEGSKIYYKTMGQGKPLLFIHGGFGLDHSLFLPHFQEMAKNYQLIFYDQRGCGHSSEHFNPEEASFDQFVTDLEVLCSDLNLERFSIIAHSFGTLIATQYAYYHPEDIEKMVFLHPAPVTTDALSVCFDELSRRLKHSDHFANFLEDPAKNIEDEEFLLDDFYKKLFVDFVFDPNITSKMHFSNNKETALKQYMIYTLFEESLFKAGYDKSYELMQVQAPTLVVHGNQDFIPAWSSAKIAEYLPHGEYFALNECGHFSYIEKPKELFDKIQNFLID